MNEGDAMTPRLAALGKFFRFFRCQRGLKQDDVAKLVQVSKNTISQIERGKQWPSMQTFLRAIDALELPDFDPTDQVVLESLHRRSKVMRVLGLVAWLGSLNDEELSYGFVRAWVGVEMMREMERRGLEHPYKRQRHSQDQLELLAPEEIEERTQHALRGIGI
jgi:DNA-binding XRE family transcriptional regulator